MISCLPPNPRGGKKKIPTLPHCVIFYWIFTIMAMRKLSQISHLRRIIPTPTLKSELHPISPTLLIAEQLQNSIPKYAEALVKPTPMQHRYLQAPGMTSQTHKIILGLNEAKGDSQRLPRLSLSSNLSASDYFDYHWAQIYKLPWFTRFLYQP